MERITIFIPAYNNEEYTEKALRSIESQTYDHIDLYLIDDASPNSLESLATRTKERLRQTGSNIELRYIRNKINLRAMNIYNAYALIKTRWAMQFPHDDWFLDSRVLERWVMLCRENPEVNLVIGRHKIEGEDAGIMRDRKKRVVKLDAGSLPIHYSKNGPAAWSSILFDYRQLKRTGFPSSKYCIYPSETNRKYLMPDDFHSSLFLLSSMGETLIDERNVSMRGMPDGSFCKTEKSMAYLGNSSFFVYSRLLSRKSGLPGMARVVYRLGLIALMLSWQIQNREKWRASEVVPEKQPMYYCIYAGYYVMSRLRLSVPISRVLSTVVCTLTKGAVVSW